MSEERRLFVVTETVVTRTTMRATSEFAAVVGVHTGIYDGAGGVAWRIGNTEVDRKVTAKEFPE
jgi:hypothetical protein